MNGENCAFLQCGPCRGYPYVEISQDIRSSSLHMYYYIVVLKDVADFTGMHLQRSLFSNCNLRLHQKRDAGTYNFLLVLRNFLGPLILSKTSCELVLKGQLYEKWRTDILNDNKEISRSLQLFQETDIARESVYLRAINRKLTIT